MLPSKYISPFSVLKFLSREWKTWNESVQGTILFWKKNSSFPSDGRTWKSTSRLPLSSRQIALNKERKQFIYISLICTDYFWRPAKDPCLCIKTPSLIVTPSKVFKLVLHLSAYPSQFKSVPPQKSNRNQNHLSCQRAIIYSREKAQCG